ncbi:MAG: lipoate--protein ligase family protein [Pirellulaceae bacterium]|nr:lipoate--protein ligase family protein [Planctomycetales bacterium]
MLYYWQPQSTVAHDLALDEALLTHMTDSTPVADTGCSADATADDCLRIWEPKLHHVVIGRSSRVQDEVRLDCCQREEISVFRRISGGAAILTGPGCLLYSVVLNRHRHPQLATLPEIHQFVLQRMATALRRLVPSVAIAGTSDLVLQSPDGRLRKFSGNSLRVTRSAVLYHGTLLIDFDTDLIGCYLKEPPRQPDYRQRRQHRDFVTCLSCSMSDVQMALREAWSPLLRCDVTPDIRQAVDELIVSRYGCEEWNR